ncbi:MAG: carbohydrate ABC transporter permease [Cephaloticoccus sp.]|nr:carbohydrate ABC transporter permease [Cephaloticoccus sp.]MCF7761193.1 carbohydrate ABC transporter permease [Cephaloticoccus sp.]
MKTPVNLTPGRILLYLLLILFAGLTVIPFVWMICASLKTQADFFTSRFLPAGDGWLGFAWDRLSLRQFGRLFTELPVARALLNSVFFASVMSLGATLFSAAGGYALSKFQFRGREWVTLFTIGTVVIPTALLLGPGFETLYHLGLVDSYAGVLLPGLAPAFGLYLFRQAMINSLPNDIIESARIDGCGEFRIFFQIVVPIMRPMISAYLIIVFIGVWNNFITPQIVLQSPELHPLSVAIFNLRGLYTDDYSLIMAGTLVSIAPVMILFLILQKEFISGLTTGAVKG